MSLRHSWVLGEGRHERAHSLNLGPETSSAKFPADSALERRAAGRAPNIEVLFRSSHAT